MFHVKHQANFMNEDIFNLSLRKYLKQVGITSQRELEQAVQQAIQSGKITGNEKIKARIVLTVPELGLSHEVEGDIKLE